MATQISVGDLVESMLYAVVEKLNPLDLHVGFNTFMIQSAESGQ